MKQNVKFSIATVIIFILIGVIMCLVTKKQQVEVPVEIPKFYPVEIPVNTEPEFRPPPIKEYKPGHVQQMGILLGEDGETLPLYGKEVRGRRDRYHYYTSTPGQQIYSIPVSYDNRDCMDDIGCQELYGQEKVSVLGKGTPYEAKLYRTENFFI